MVDPSTKVGGKGRPHACDHRRGHPRPAPGPAARPELLPAAPRCRRAHRTQPDGGRRDRGAQAVPGRAHDGPGRPVLAPRPRGPTRQRAGRSQRRTVAPPPRIRDRELRPRRRDRTPRHQRRRRRDRRGRHAMDDRRRRDPARRAADRADVPQRRAVPRRPAVGQPPRRTQDDTAALPGDHPRRPRAPHLRRRRCTGSSHRR